MRIKNYFYIIILISLFFSCASIEKNTDSVGISANNNLEEDRETIKEESTNINKNPYTDYKLAIIEPNIQIKTKTKDWMATFIQGALNSYFSQYSSMKIITREHIKECINEIKLSETDLIDEKDTLNIGRFLSADLLAISKLVQRTTDYIFSIELIMSETGEIVSSFTSDPIPLKNIEKANFLAESAYQILLQMKYEKNKINKLKELAESDSENSIIEANKYCAKGILAEEQSGSVIETMYYYQKATEIDKTIKESIMNYQRIVSNLAVSTTRDKVLANIELYKDWQKIWDELFDFYVNHWVSIEYYPIKQLSFDMKKGVVFYQVEIVQCTDPIYSEIRRDIYNVFYKLINDGYVLPMPRNAPEMWIIDSEPLWFYQSDEYLGWDKGDSLPSEHGYVRTKWELKPKKYTIEIQNEKNEILASKTLELSKYNYCCDERVMISVSADKITDDTKVVVHSEEVIIKLGAILEKPTPDYTFFYNSNEKSYYKKNGRWLIYRGY